MKWQEHCDQLFSELYFYQSPHVPQLFYLNSGNKLKVLAVKIVDDVLFSGKKQNLEKIVSSIKSKYKLETIVHGPSSFLFFGLQIIQDSDYSTMIHGDSKLEALNCYSISRQRRKMLSEVLNEVELRSFRSVSSSTGRLGANASLFCALYSSWLQQKAPTPTVHDLISQINYVKQLKKLGTSISYLRPENGSYTVSLLIFTYASHPSDHGLLVFLSGLLFGNFASGSVFHVLSWSSRKSRRPVKSIASAETSAAGEAIDEGKVIVRAFEDLFGFKIQLSIAIDSNDFLPIHRLVD